MLEMYEMLPLLWFAVMSKLLYLTLVLMYVSVNMWNSPWTCSTLVLSSVRINYNFCLWQCEVFGNVVIQEGLPTAPVHETLAWSRGHQHHCHQHRGHPVHRGNLRFPSCQPCSKLLNSESAFLSVSKKISTCGLWQNLVAVCPSYSVSKQHSLEQLQRCSKLVNVGLPLMNWKTV